MARTARLTRALVGAGGLALAVAIAGVVALAAPETTPAGSGSRTDDVDLAVEKYVLANGLEVILSPDPSAATVATNIWYHVGAVDERAGRTGFAHLFEHMMFKGSGHVPADKIDTLTEAVGAYTNASTSFDYTNYVIPDLPPEQLELALWIESDRMGFLLDRLDARNLANQIAVVRNERRQNREQSPYGLTYEAVYQQLFPKGHPYHAAVIGSHADIAGSRLDDVREFFRTYYVPNNATLAITGNFDPAGARSLIEKYFATIAAGPEPPKAAPSPPGLTAEKRVRLTDDVELPKLTLAWLTPTYFAPGDAEADVLGQILAGDDSGLLNARLIREKQIAQEVYAYQESTGQSSIFQIEVTAAPGHTAAELEREVDAVLDELRATAPDAARVAAARLSLAAGVLRGVEAIGGFGDRADQLNLYNHYTGDPNYLNEDLARYRAVEPEEVRGFIGTYLGRDARLVIHTAPGKRVLPADPAGPAKLPPADPPVASTEPWRDTVPGPGPTVPSTLPRIGGFTLDNGMRVFTVPRGTLPLITATVASVYGSANDPAGRAGLAELLGRAMREGDTSRSAEQTATDVAALGADLRSITARDGLSLSMDVLTEQAPQGVALLAALARDPAFRKADVTRVRKNLATEITSSRDDVLETARGAVLPLVYGTGHPYDHQPIGTPAGVRKVTAADLEAQHARAFTPATTALILAGDVTRERARELATEAFGSWQGSAELPPTPGAARPDGPRLALVDVPGATQTAIRFGLPGVPRGEPRYDELNVGNQILGGLFTSRLNSNLREKRGYTYGVGSAFAPGRGTAPFVISTPVEARYTGASIRQIRAEIRRITRDPVTADEFTRGRQSFLASVAILFPTTATAAETTAELFRLGLPTDFYDGLPGRLESLTAASLRDRLAEFLDLDAMIVVVVGDRTVVEPQLRKLGLGRFALIDADGRPVTVRE